MSIATVTSKGQITIPVEVRRALRLHAGTRVEFIQRPSGSYELVPATISVKDLKGVVKAPRKPVSIDDMNEAVVETAVERSRR